MSCWLALFLKNAWLVQPLIVTKLVLVLFNDEILLLFVFQTFAELKEEESVLLNEKIHLKKV